MHLPSDTQQAARNVYSALMDCMENVYEDTPEVGEPRIQDMLMNACINSDELLFTYTFNWNIF